MLLVQDPSLLSLYFAGGYQSKISQHHCNGEPRLSQVDSNLELNEVQVLDQKKLKISTSKHQKHTCSNKQQNESERDR